MNIQVTKGNKEIILYCSYEEAIIIRDTLEFCLGGTDNDRVLYGLLYEFAKVISPKQIKEK